MADKNTEKKNLEDYDSRMQTLIRIEMEKAEKRRKLLIGFLALIAVGSLGYFGFYYATSSKSGGRFDELSDLVGSDALSNMDKDSGAGYIASLSQKDNDEVTPDVLEKYRTLYNSNRDLIGWIKISDTVIDYPVMQADDNEYYLSHNFDRKDDKAGCLFLDSKCDAVHGNDNYIIYGHHLTSGRMFSSLSDYESESYYKKHPTITFDTIYEEGTYHYDTMAFGEIVKKRDELIDLLIQYMEESCVMKDEYRRRADDFYEYNDHNNCERVYNEMIRYKY